MAEISEKAKVYHALYETMITQLRAGDCDSAEHMANSLLLKADLPFMIRVRCHSVLGAACAPGRGWDKARSGFLNHARAALHLLNDARSEGLDISDKRIEDAERHLKEAENDMERLRQEGAFDKSIDERVAEEEEELSDFDEDKLFADASENEEEQAQDTLMEEEPAPNPESEEQEMEIERPAPQQEADNPAQPSVVNTGPVSGESSKGKGKATARVDSGPGGFEPPPESSGPRRQTSRKDELAKEGE